MTGPVERSILEDRARALARPLAPPAAAGIEAITFALADELYAIESRLVVSVFRLVELALLPGAQPPVFGVAAWRGRLLTILDLRLALGVPANGLSDLSRVIVLGRTEPAFGILADAVRELVRLPLSSIKAPMEGVAANRTYLRGVTDHAMLVLDAAALLRLHGGAARGGGG